MSALNDEIRRATGLPINDGLAAHFSKTATESMQDAEHRFLLAQVAVVVSAAVADMWYVYLRSLGHTGALNDMKLAYWKLQ